jgi:predicted permease
VLFGLAPALQARRTDLVATLKNDTAQAGGRRSFLRGALVVSQVTFTMVLLGSAGLFVRSVANAHQLDVGFRTDHMLVASVDLFGAGYSRDRGQQALTTILENVRALPGVESVTLARRVPLGISTGNSSTSLEPEGYVAPKDDPAYAYLNWVGPDYFHTMGIPVIAGREYTRTDGGDQPEVFVVNRAFAARYWPGQDAIGKRVRFGRNWYSIVGVVADSKYRRLNEPAAPFVYLSTSWNYRPDVTLQVRTTGEPLGLAGALREVVRRVDPKLPLFDVMTMEQHVRGAAFQQRLAAIVLMAFGALALLLASIGLYATMAYAVSRRTRELGARLAMGATRGDIMRLVLGQAFRLTAIGLVIGIVLSAGAAQAFKSLLVGVPPLDAMTFVAVTILLAGIAGLASYGPARRASRLDPLKALRYE